MRSLPPTYSNRAKLYLMSWSLIFCALSGIPEVEAFPFQQSKKSDSRTYTGANTAVKDHFYECLTIGVSPADHVFGTFSLARNSPPKGFTLYGTELKIISSLPSHKEFHATDGSDTGIVVGFCAVHQPRVKTPVFVASIFDPESGLTEQLSGGLSKATGISANGNLIVGTIQQQPSLWNRIENGWSKTKLLGPNRELVKSNYVCVSPNGNRIAATVRFAARRSRNLIWRRDEFDNWQSEEVPAAGQLRFATKQINDFGVQVGTITKPDFFNAAAIVDPKTGLTVIQSPVEDSHSFGQDINNKGQMLVYSYNQSSDKNFVWQNGSHHNPFVEANVSAIIAYGISNRKIVVGIAAENDNRTSAFISKP